MHGEDTAAGQRPVGHLDDAAGDRAPPLGRLAGQVEALDTAGDPALQSAGQRLDRPVVAAQRAIAHDVPEGRQGFQQLVRHVVQAGHRAVLVDPAPVAFVEQRAVAHVVEHGTHRVLGEGDVAVRLVKALRQVAGGEIAGDLLARALALDVGEQADDGHEAQHDGGQPDIVAAAMDGDQRDGHRQDQGRSREREGAAVEAARRRAGHDQAERQRPQGVRLLGLQGREEAAHQPVGEGGRHGGDGIEPAPAREAEGRGLAPVQHLDPPRAPDRQEIDCRRHEEHPERGDAGEERRRDDAEDRQRQQLGQGRDLDQPAGHDLLDPLGVDAGDVELAHILHGGSPTYRPCVTGPRLCIVSVVAGQRTIHWRYESGGDLQQAGPPAAICTPIACVRVGAGDRGGQASAHRRGRG